jgi:hypothetical protein
MRLPFCSSAPGLHEGRMRRQYCILRFVCERGRKRLRIVGMKYAKEKMKKK